jgi:glycyl-tRNA synthetase beta chain
MPKELLLEIGTEEIPARFIPGALKSLEELADKALAAARIEHGPCRGMGNPRRLMLHVKEVAERQPDSVRVTLGPPKSVAYDAAGKPTKAAAGFAKAQGVDVDSLTISVTDKGEYICATVEEKGKEAGEVLSEILPKLILSVPFPKSMRWMDREIRFARPIHWIVAVLGGDVVPFEIDGIKSGNLTRGHRFMSPGAFRVNDFEYYMHQTKDNFTIVDQDARREMVRSQIAQAASAIGAKALPDDGLLEEVSYLVEYPVTVLGSFDKTFLSLPREALVNSMREHQRYFALTDGDGSLMPNFITISNTKAEDMDVVRAGNERVLRARLSDAKYFFETDMKRRLSDRVDDLKRVLFQKELGTVHDKTMRIVGLSEYVSRAFFGDREVEEAAKRAALLCKADLVTSMVYEFPNLQGIMGGEYARRTGEGEDVAKAIVEHYMPRFSGDDVPSGAAGTTVSVADKMDTIAGIFSIGKTPTGSEDPYALRRQALGVIAIIYKWGVRVSLRALISKAVELVGVAEGKRPGLEAEILEFFRARVNNQLTSEGFLYDIVDAVLARDFDDIIDVRARVSALSGFRGDPEFASFITAFKRVANIIPEGFTGTLDEALIREPAEKELHGHYLEVKDEVSRMIEAGEYDGALRRIAAIRPFVDKFFDDVMVMDKDPAVRDNHLALMGLLAGMFLHVADLKKIVI